MLHLFACSSAKSKHVDDDEDDRSVARVQVKEHLQILQGDNSS